MELTILTDIFSSSFALSKSKVTHSTWQNTHTAHVGFCGHEIFERNYLSRKKKQLKFLCDFKNRIYQRRTHAARFRSNRRWKVYTIILSWPVDYTEIRQNRRACDMRHSLCLSHVPRWSRRNVFICSKNETSMIKTLQS